MAVNSSISNCSNISTIYFTTEEAEAKLLYFQEKFVFSGIIFPCILMLGFLSSSPFMDAVHCITKLHAVNYKWQPDQHGCRWLDFHHVTWYFDFCTPLYGISCKIWGFLIIKFGCIFRIHVANSVLRWKRSRTKLVLIPVFFRGIQATFTKYWDQV